MKNNHFVLRISSYVIALFFVVIIPIKVQAIGAGGVAAYPTRFDASDPRTKSWFIYNLKAGESKEDSITLENIGGEEVSIRLYAVDSAINNMGGFALEQESNPKDEIGAWIKLDIATTTLKVGGKKDVKFTITIPENADVGEHSGGIIIQKDLTEEQKKQSETGGVVIATRLGVRVYEIVPGNIIKDVQIDSANLLYNKDTEKYSLSVTLNNNSNVTVEPEVRVELKDKFFNRHNNEFKNLVLIPRGSQTHIDFQFSKPPIGRYEIKITANFNNEDGNLVVKTYKQRLFLTVVPWMWVAIISIIILANILFLIINYIIKKSQKKYHKKYKVKAGDDLQKIASKLGISWKKIACLNKIKAPYTLSAGQMIDVIDKEGVMVKQAPSTRRVAPRSGQALRPGSGQALRPGSGQALRPGSGQALRPGSGQSKTIEEKTDKKSVSQKNTFLDHVHGRILPVLKVLYLIIAIMVVVATASVMIVGLDNFSKKANQATQKSIIKEQGMVETATNSVAEEPMVASTSVLVEPAVPTIDKTAVSINILNGSGIKGEAYKALVMLEAKGYENIKTANASKFDYKETSICCGLNMTDAICEDIKEALSSKYTAIIEKDCQIASDIQIIIGQE